MGRRAKRLVLTVPVFLAACAYDPPIAGDHDAATYRADLRECRRTVDAEVDLDNRRTFPGFLISPFTGPPRKRAGIRACMTRQGYTIAGG